MAPRRDRGVPASPQRPKNIADAQRVPPGRLCQTSETSLTFQRHQTKPLNCLAVRCRSAPILDLSVRHSEGFSAIGAASPPRAASWPRRCQAERPSLPSLGSCSGAQHDSPLWPSVVTPAATIPIAVPIIPMVVIVRVVSPAVIVGIGDGGGVCLTYQGAA
jgi:hypothetical protein